MAIPTTSLLSVMATWPVLRDDGFDPSIPSPWRGIVVPDTDDPLHPVISILFNHAINPAIYTSDSALGPYVLLTSVTDPSARNINTFKNVRFDTITNVLTFQPFDPLIAGSTYGATVRGSTRDSAGRSLERAYYWEFEVDASAYQGIPVPVLLSPSDQSVVTAYPIQLKWGIDSSFDNIPQGQQVVFVVSLYSDQEKSQTLWTGNVQDSA
jgi:hypothetical protein